MNEARQGELQALATRKYLDALCVYFWVATSLLFSLFTFGLFVLLGHKLTAEVVFTSLALFNVLIAPLNSFPWVLNGTVEAVVSLRRLQGFLSSWETKSDWAYQPEEQNLGPDPGSALVEAQRIALAEGLTLETALPMSRADSSDLYTTINMERLPSGALPRYMSNAPSLASWSPMRRQQSTSAAVGQNLSAVEQAGPPPPDSGGYHTPRAAADPKLSSATRSFSTSFKGWGQGDSTPALQRQGSTSGASASSISEASDQGIITVLSDSNRRLSTHTGNSHSIVLSGASFSWQPTLGRGRVVSSQAGRRDSTRHGVRDQSRSGVLQPLLSEAAEDVAIASSDSLVLRELNLTVKTGHLLVVTGEMGAGDRPGLIWNQVVTTSVCIDKKR